ncbi:MAG: hypothetical protein WBX15_10735 [Thermoanaerobaculia bacterium]
MTEVPSASGGKRQSVLKDVVDDLLRNLQEGVGDKEKRKQVEEWLRSLADKYPEFSIGEGLREYYLAEAGRLRKEFDSASDLTEKLAVGRMVESFLDRAAEFDRLREESARMS